MYIGNTPALSYTSFAKQDFSTSATTTYTLDNPVTNANELALFINFVRQEPTTAYSASGTTLTLTSATASSDDMYCVYLGKAVQTVNPPNASVGLSQLTASGTKDATTFLRGDNTFASAQGKFESQLLQVRHETSGTTHGGDAVATTDNVRILNTIVTNEITSASLSSNRITLPSGTYYIDHVGFAYDCSSHRTLLYNITDSSVTLLGSNTYADVNNEVGNHSFLKGRFTISSQKVFEIRHYTDAAKSTLGLGVAGSDSRTNIFADVQIWKVA